MLAARTRTQPHSSRLELALAFATLSLIALAVRSAVSRPAEAQQSASPLNTCTTRFSDVNPGDYFYEPVLWLACRGTVSGYANGTFLPYYGTTRAQFTKIVVLVYGWPLLNPTSGHFSDVPPGTPFYPYIETAVARGIISGYADGTFLPGNAVSRGQIAKMVVLAAGWTLLNPPVARFNDVPPGSPFYSAVETAAARHILSGYADGSFRAGNPATRGQVAKIVYNAVTIGCPMFPPDNIWNKDISTLPIHPLSATYLATIGTGGHLHADFGSGTYDGQPFGIPWITVAGSQPRVPVTFDYADESDPGPYPIPTFAPIEGGPTSTGDRHVLVVAQGGGCSLYETWDSHPQADGSWQAGSGARWDLSSNALRPDTWTSADAAGLPILPGLVRYDEVSAGAIRHAVRFTANLTQNTYLWPARHQAGSANTAYPPMGLRVRLKASFDISSYPPADQVILTALKQYGMILADNGSNWFITGTQDERWDNDVLSQLSAVPGAAFEAVDESSLMIDPNSGQSR
ncbi:MAG TPA: S-layer homology domain-containing protein [Chloroflexia bacterium]|nr:S-layer homology domain-containing protein [Chloroflexia bacterium]